MARFKDDEPIRCEQCGELICAGEEYIEYEGVALCGEDCLKDLLLENASYETKYLMAAEDKEADYGDMMYDSMKDDALMEGDD